MNSLRNIRGDISLHDAARNDATETATLLIQHGTDINAQGKLDFTPLHHAVLTDATETATLLIQHGTDIRAKKRLIISGIKILIGCGKVFFKVKHLILFKVKYPIRKGWVKFFSKL